MDVGNVSGNKPIFTLIKEVDNEGNLSATIFKSNGPIGDNSINSIECAKRILGDNDNTFFAPTSKETTGTSIYDFGKIDYQA